MESENEWFEDQEAIVDLRKLPPKLQKDLYAIKLNMEYASKQKLMIGGAQPPEWDEYNKLLWMEYQKKLDEFKPD